MKIGISTGNKEALSVFIPDRVFQNFLTVLKRVIKVVTEPALIV